MFWYYCDMIVALLADIISKSYCFYPAALVGVVLLKIKTIFEWVVCAMSIRRIEKTIFLVAHICCQ